MFKRLFQAIRILAELPDRIDRRLAFPVPLPTYFGMLTVVVGTLNWKHHHAIELDGSVKLGPYLGLGGALTACIGAFALARPIIRAGGYKAWHEQSRTIDGGTFNVTAKQKREEKEGLRDAFAVNVIAPAFGIVGTIINGASGLYS